MKRPMTAMGFAALLLCLITEVSLADGGQVIAVATLGSERAVMMVNPSRPTVGVLAVVVRVSGGLEPVNCHLSAHDETGDDPIECSLAPDPDGLGHRGLIECAQASRWTISVRVASPQGDLVLKGELLVAQAPPNWRSQAPWALAWMPIALLLCIGQIARRRMTH